MTGKEWFRMIAFFLVLLVCGILILTVAKRGDAPEEELPVQDENLEVPELSPEQAITEARDQEALRLRTVEMYAEALWNGGLNTIILRNEAEGSGISWEALCSLADSEDEHLSGDAFKSWAGKRDLARKIANAALKVAAE